MEMPLQHAAVADRLRFIDYPNFVMEAGGDVACILYERNGGILVDSVGYDLTLAKDQITEYEESERSKHLRVNWVMGGLAFGFSGFITLTVLAMIYPSVEEFRNTLIGYCFNSEKVLLVLTGIIFCWLGFVAGVLIDNRRKNKDTFLEETLKEIDWITSLKKGLEK